MPIYELTKDELRKIEETSFSKAKIRERGDLQRLLRNQIEIISPDTLIIAEEFGEWDERDDENFAQDVQVVLISAEFSKEITSTVLWLNDYGLDIRCVRMKPYDDNGRTLVDVEQVIPLPEASAYQVSVSEKKRKEKSLRIQNRDMTKYDVTVFGKSQQKLAKRNAIFFVVKNLCDSGVSPEKIHELINWKKTLFLQVEGSLNSDNFIRIITTQRGPGGRKVENRRWYCDDEELIHFNGKTYAFIKMWGNRWGAAMRLLKDNYPDAKIDFGASKED